jgi:hypothetical protein
MSVMYVMFTFVHNVLSVLGKVGAGGACPLCNILIGPQIFLYTFQNTVARR